MKKLALRPWQSIPPSLVFPWQGLFNLKINWPVWEDKKEYLDPLTGIPNRRAFDEAAELVVEAANQQSSGFGLLIFDIDHFKKLNDTYGHPAGDKVLKKFALAVQSTLRQEDLFTRIGGEEFVIITPVWKRAFEIGERVRQKIESQSFNIKGDVNVKLTCSFGCAVFPQEASDFPSLFELADKALYKAKQNGRNRGAKGAN